MLIIEDFRAKLSAVIAKLHESLPRAAAIAQDTGQLPAAATANDDALTAVEIFDAFLRMFPNDAATLRQSHEKRPEFSPEEYFANALIEHANLEDGLLQATGDTVQAGEWPDGHAKVYAVRRPQASNRP